MAKPSPLGRLARRGLVIVLVALAAAAVYLWTSQGGDHGRTFARIYQVSLSQATGNLNLEATLGLPIASSQADAKYEYYSADGRDHIRFHFPVRGPRAAAMIEGEAVQLGRNWLIVELVARFPGQNGQIDLSPNIDT